MSNMVYNFRCEYAKMHSLMHKYAIKRARIPARVAGIVRKYPAEKRENVAQLARVAAADTIQAGEFAGGVASGLAPSDRWRMCQAQRQRFAVKPLAALVASVGGRYARWLRSFPG